MDHENLQTIATISDQPKERKSEARDLAMKLGGRLTVVLKRQNDGSNLVVAATLGFGVAAASSGVW